MQCGRAKIFVPIAWRVEAGIKAGKFADVPVVASIFTQAQFEGKVRGIRRATPPRTVTNQFVAGLRSVVPSGMKVKDSAFAS